MTRDLAEKFVRALKIHTNATVRMHRRLEVPGVGSDEDRRMADEAAQIMIELLTVDGS